MTCPGCAFPQSGLYIAGCRACTLRDIASGPAFFQSVRASRLSDAYKVQLRALGSVDDAHAEVKAMAKTLFTGATRA
jgi:hypothetical protein